MRGAREAQFPRRRVTMRASNHCGVRRMTAEGAEKSQQSHKYFLHYSTFASERSQFRTRWRQTCFLPWALSNLVTPLDTEAAIVVGRAYVLVVGTVKM